MPQLLYIAIGLISGIFGGLFGIGGGIVIIPALVYLCGFTQHQAQGTSLAILIPPIGLLAALKYYQSGNVKLGVALFVCAGFFVGGLIGANFAQAIASSLLRKLFGLFLLFVSLRMVFFK